MCPAKNLIPKKSRLNLLHRKLNQKVRLGRKLQPVPFSSFSFFSYAFDGAHRAPALSTPNPPPASKGMRALPGR